LHVCLGEYGTVVEVRDDARAVVRYADGTLREVSLAVLCAARVTVQPGDIVAVSIGIALHLVDDEEIPR
jgi:hydrogenase maturation factor